MRSDHRTDDVVRLTNRAHPVAHRFVGRVFERLRTGIDFDHFRAHQTHAEHVQLLPPHVFAAHVDAAFEAEACARGCRRDTVLAGARFSNDARLPHALCEQRLPKRVVDFVRACVCQVFALQPNLRATRVRGKSRRRGELRWSTDELAQQSIDFTEETRVCTRRAIGHVEFFERSEQRLRHVAAAELAEATGCVGNLRERSGRHGE